MLFVIYLQNCAKVIFVWSHKEAKIWLKSAETLDTDREKKV